MTRIIQSDEEYKGYVLKVVLTRMYNKWTRSCEVWENGVSIAISKTKKESKDLIDNGCYKALNHQM